MRLILTLSLFVLAASVFIAGCKKSDPEKTDRLSTEKVITSFQLRPQENPGLRETINGVISGDTIVVPYSGSLAVSGLMPYITYNGAALSSGSGTRTDFTQPVVYTVKAEDGSMKEYDVFVTANKIVYIGSDDGNLYAIDAASGVQRWKFETGGAIRSSPTTAHGRVYVGSGDGSLYAIDSATGSLKWMYAFNYPVNCCPTVSGDAVYAYCKANLVALDTATGSVKWKYYTNDMGYSTQSPTVVNGKVYLSLFSGDFTIGAVDAVSGTPVWGYRAGAGFSNPAVVNGVVYAGDEVHKLMALDAATGAMKWQYSDRNLNGGTSPTVGAGKIFMPISDGTIYAIDSVAGTIQWKCVSIGYSGVGFQDATGITVGLWSSPMYANGLVFCGNNDGLNYAINAATGAVEWKYGEGVITRNSIATQATVANDVVYFGTTSGQVVALDAMSGKMKWEFQTKGGVFSGACVIGNDGLVRHPGTSGDTQ